MEKQVELLRADPVRELTLAEIEDECLIPWALQGRTIRKLIVADARGPKLLGARITGTASQRRYLVPARGLIRYLQEYGPALMATVRKQPKQRHGKRTRGGGRGEEKGGARGR